MIARIIAMIGFDMLLRPSHLRVKSSFNIRPTLLRRLIRKFGYADANQQLKWIRGDLYERARKPLTSKSKVRTFPATMESMTGLVHRLLRDEPLAYILGNQPFGSLLLQVSPPVLIPRPETEEWTMELLKRIKAETSSQSSIDRPQMRKEWKILDLCTGSGCIPLLLCNEWPHRSTPLRAHAVDIAQESIRLTQINAENIIGPDVIRTHTSYTPHESTLRIRPRVPNSLLRKVREGQPKITFNIWNSDICSPDFRQWLSTYGPFDVITCNPPYIPDLEYEEDLPRSVKVFEDHRALKGGEDGLNFYRRIVDLLISETQDRDEMMAVDGFELREGKVLKRGGFLVLEFGKGQAYSVAEIMRRSNSVKDLELWTDAYGIERALFCRAK